MVMSSFLFLLLERLNLNKTNKKIDVLVIFCRIMRILVL